MKNSPKRRQVTPTPPVAPSGYLSVLEDTQRQIVAAGLLAAPASTLLSLPTGSGKTYLARHAIRQTLRQGLRAAYLCPLRALARELLGAWRTEFPDRRIGLFTGEMGVDETLDLPAPAAADLLIATPEKFDFFLRQFGDHLDWLAKLDLLVVDELHLLADSGRGATLEGLITRAKAINPYLRILGLSATLGNRDEIGRWMGASVFHSERRAVPLDWRIVPFAANGQAVAQKATLALDEARVTTETGAQTIIFCQSRPRTESLAAACLAAGLRAAAHHAGLSRARRESVELAFRQRDLDVVVATPTLAMGVNLPCRKVVLHDLQRYGAGGWDDLSVIEVWQLAGRAGRPGLDPCGEVVLLAPKHDQVAARRYLAGRFEPVRSTLAGERRLAEQVLVAVGSRMCRTDAQLERTLGRTLFAQQSAKEFFAAQLKRCLNRMLAAGMVERQEDGLLVATRLGRVAVRYQLSPDTVLGWKSLLSETDNGDQLTFLDMLIIIAGSADFNARGRADIDDLPALTDALNQEPMALKAVSPACWAPVYTQAVGRDLIAAIKIAIVLRAWTRLGDEDDAAATMGMDGHQLTEARKEMVRMLCGFEAVIAICRPGPDEPVVDDGEPRLAERARCLRAMVATGLDEQHATLGLVDGIGPVLARRLVEAGIADIEDLALAEPAQVAGRGISTDRASRWIAEAGELLGQGGAYRYREQRIAAPGYTHPGGAVIDYYRWRRAGTLTVVQSTPDSWQVTGGSEPHHVHKLDGEFHCDCPDAAKGHMCKHLLAVRAGTDDPAIPALDRPFPSEADASFSLLSVWNQRSTSCR